MAGFFYWSLDLLIAGNYVSHRVFRLYFSHKKGLRDATRSKLINTHAQKKKCNTQLFMLMK